PSSCIPPTTLTRRAACGGDRSLPQPASAPSLRPEEPSAGSISNRVREGGRNRRTPHPTTPPLPPGSLPCPRDAGGPGTQQQGTVLS
ncbi:hypothetical protein NDU88_004934, partial [Pleurodeles waltl]